MITSLLENAVFSWKQLKKTRRPPLGGLPSNLPSSTAARHVCLGGALARPCTILVFFSPPFSLSSLPLSFPPPFSLPFPFPFSSFCPEERGGGGRGEKGEKRERGGEEWEKRGGKGRKSERRRGQGEKPFQRECWRVRRHSSPPQRPGVLDFPTFLLSGTLPQRTPLPEPA